MEINRKNPPKFHSIKIPKFELAESCLLSNGTRLHFAHGGMQNVVKIELVFSGGKASEIKNATSIFTTALLNAGTEKYSASYINEKFDGLAAYVDMNPGLDNNTVVMHCLSKHVVTLLDLLGDCINEANFPNDQLELQRARQIQHLKTNQLKSSFSAARAFRKVLFGEHNAYGAFGEIQDFVAISSDDLAEYHQASIKGCLQHVIVSGKFNEGEIKSCIDRLGGYNTQDETSPSFDLNAPYAQEHITMDNSEQTSIVMGKLSGTMKVSNYGAFELANKLLGGFFGSRLMQVIREKHGLTYGIYSGVQHLEKASFFQISADITADKQALVFKLIQEELTKLIDKKVNVKELELVKNYLLGEFLSDTSTPMDIASKSKKVILNGLEDNFYQEYLSQVANATPEDIQSVFSSSFQPDTFHKVSAG